MKRGALGDGCAATGREGYRIERLIALEGRFGRLKVPLGGTLRGIATSYAHVPTDHRRRNSALFLWSRRVRFGPAYCYARNTHEYLGFSAVYLLRAHVDGCYLVTGRNFDCVTNLHEVVSAGGFLDLPSLVQVPDGAVYGTCDISARLLNQDAANCRLRVASVDSSSIVLRCSVSPSTEITCRKKPMGWCEDW